jgi:sulfonate transport system ATP-binding protein
VSAVIDVSAGIGVSAGIRVRGLTQTFGANRILDDLHLDVAPGEFVALLGRSGSGKTTLLRILAGLDTPVSGDVVIPQPRAVAFQEPRLMPWKRTWENVVIGLPHAGARERAAAALAEVGLDHRADAWPLTLSGGEAQRAALARALVREPKLLLLDEPFAALDALTRMRMHVLVEALWRRHRPAVLLVTHDVDEAILLADRVLVLADGRIACDIPVMMSRPRSPAYAGFFDIRRTVLGALGIDITRTPDEASI